MLLSAPHEWTREGPDPPSAAEPPWRCSRCGSAVYSAGRPSPRMRLLAPWPDGSVPLETCDEAMVAGVMGS